MHTHVEGLKKKHAQLEKFITEENSRPCPNYNLILELKHKKLRLKEKIYRLMQTYSPSPKAF